MDFRRGKKEGSMRNRKQATFRNKPPRKTRKLPSLTTSSSEREVQHSFLTQACPHPANPGTTVIQPAMPCLCPSIQLPIMVHIPCARY